MIVRGKGAAEFEFSSDKNSAQAIKLFKSRVALARQKYEETVSGQIEEEVRSVLSDDLGEEDKQSIGSTVRFNKDKEKVSFEIQKENWELSELSSLEAMGRGIVEKGQQAIKNLGKKIKELAAKQGGVLGAVLHAVGSVLEHGADGLDLLRDHFIAVSIIIILLITGSYYTFKGPRVRVKGRNINTRAIKPVANAVRCNK